MTIRSKNIIVGGGGLWGLDMNLNTFLMSMYLFAARFVLRKKVFLVGVGYYNSTTRLGHIGAHFAGKAANEIIVRDGESYTNFKRIQPSTELDRDIAFYAGQLDLSEYHVDVTRLEKLVSIKQQTVFIAVRRFKQKHRNSFNLIVERYIVQHPDKQFILALLELKDVDTESYELLQQWRRRFDNVQVLDEAINPLVLFAYFQKHHDKLMAMAPQFHLILTAHLAGVPFLPVVYDNKVAQLLSSIGITPERQIPIQDLQLEDIESFIDAASEKGG
jgi:polysaccharide pyruvyl transferase WcaK-like protein